MTLLFNIDNQRIITANTRYVVADSREYLRARFVFTSDWDGCTKTAIFAGKDGTYEVLLTNDVCTVPHEVLGGRFGVSVFGINGDMRITTDTAYITVHQSGFAEGETPSDPTPTVYEQLLNEIEENKQAAEADAAKLQAAVETEAETREETDTTLREAIVAESEARAAADTTLEQNKADKTSLLTKADKEYNSGFIGGKNAKLNAVGGVAAGLNAQASSGSATGSGAQASEGMAAGNGAYTSHGGAGGKDAYSMHGGSLGRGAKTLHGAAVGDGAQTVDAEGNPITGIQLGTGTNTEEGTAKFFDYTMMNADGTIPKERTPDTINRYNVSELPSKSVTYDFSDGVSRFTAVERMTVSVADGVQVITSGSNAGNKYGLAHFDFGSVSDNATRLIVDYDTKYDGGRWEIGLVDLSKRPGASDKTTYDDTGVAYRAGTRDGTNYWINGTNKYDTSLNDVWVHTHVDIDMSARTLKYEVSVGETLKYTDEISIPDSVETVDGIEIYTWTTETMYVDNIAIKALYNVDENGMYVTPDGEYIYRDGEPVKLGGEVDLSSYYTKTEMDTKLTQTAKLYQVEVLPTENIDENGIYLMGNLPQMLDEANYDIRAYVYDGTWRTVGVTAESVNDAIAAASTEISQGIYTTLGSEVLQLSQWKADKPTITTPTGASAELSDNTEARFGEVASLTLTLPTDTTGDYISSVVFTSGATATSLTYPDTITMIGTDCIDGVFAPVANKRYTVIVAYDGAGLVGYVAGHEVTV